MEFEASVNKKVRYMANHIWDGLGNTQIDAFLKNFEKEDKMVGWTMLDMLIYYSSEQEQSIVSNLIRQLKRDIWIESGMAKQDLPSEQINLEFEKILRKMCLVPVDDSNPAASAFGITPQIEVSKEMPGVTYINVDEIPLMVAMKYKYFVFYDDLIGTGNQFEKFWRHTEFGSKSNRFKLSELVEKNTDVRFYLLTLGGCEAGLQRLKKSVPKVKIIVSEYFPEHYDVLNEKNEYWELNPDNKDVVCEFIKKKEKELNYYSKYSKNLPVLFQRGRASNTTLSLYWYGKDGQWEGLHKR